jgi:hypothetical protein
MVKRKVFTKTDLSVPQIEHKLDTAGNVVILHQAVPPTNTVVNFGRNSSSHRRFDFAPWYGAGIDAIAYACQRQIERFLAGQDGNLSVPWWAIVTAGCVISSTTACFRRRLLSVT